MPRRGRAPRRELAPDPKFHSRPLQAFINKVMEGGKKSTAERIVYGALDMAETQANRPAMDIFDQALRNATPAQVVCAGVAEAPSIRCYEAVASCHTCTHLS